MATIFTQIVNGEIPSYKIAETDKFYAFLDINPIAEGHTLVIPKQETDYLFDLDDDLLAEHIKFAKRVALAIDESLAPLRTGIIVEGLEVPHAHIHLVPIYYAEQPVSLAHKIEVGSSRMQDIAEMISKAFK